MECIAESSIKETQTQKSINLSGSFGLSMGPTQKSPKSTQTQASGKIDSQAKSFIGTQTQKSLIDEEIVTQLGFKNVASDSVSFSDFVDF